MESLEQDSRIHSNVYAPNAVVRLLPHSWDNIFVETTARSVSNVQRSELLSVFCLYFVLVYPINICKP